MINNMIFIFASCIILLCIAILDMYHELQEDIEVLATRVYICEQIQAQNR